MARTRKNADVFGSLFEEDYLLRTLGRIAHDPDVALTELVANAWMPGLHLLTSQFLLKSRTRLSSLMMGTG